jgi:anti-sigma regulatory factor (Ser/Thr protein kinase)
MSSRVSAPVTMRLPFAPSSVPIARQQLRTWMTESGEPCEAVEDARVVVSELVANAIRHARPLPDGSILVRWSREEGGIRLSVTDGGGETRPRNVHASSTAVAGRGMAIVEVLARRWWAEDGSARSTVHALLNG